MSRGGEGLRRLPTWYRAGLLAALLLLPAPGSAQGAGRGPARGVEGPPGSELTVWVMTMGVGAEVWERFGHNAIVIEDHRRGTSTAYNYGMFSFRQDHFILRFLQGRMLYWMAGYPTRDDVPRYIAAGRSVWRQELALAPAARLALLRDLQANALPANRFYRYDYYLDNCSTRVRDALDRALGGALQRQMQGPASATFRAHTQRLNANNPLLYTGLLLALGHGVDAPGTRWEEMFLPLKLREYLREATVPDSTGQPVPLVRREEAEFESTLFPVPDRPPRWLPGFLALGVLAGIGAWWGGGRPGAAFPVLGGGWALLTGVAGAVLAGLWAFTDHAMAGRNENVLQCSVVALMLGVVLVSGRRERVGRLATGLAMVVGGLSLLGLLLKLLPGFDQVNGQILALTVPANLGLAAGVRRWAARA